MHNSDSKSECRSEKELYDFELKGNSEKFDDSETIALLPLALVSETSSLRCTRSQIFQQQVPAVRHEWRDLNQGEQANYIDAVECLSTHASVSNLKGTWHDDFSRIHRHIGLTTHFSAAFLAWHRYFIHVYETVLKKQCNYHGNLPYESPSLPLPRADKICRYWDWSLDSSDLYASPVWDNTTGFGGNSNITLPPTLNYGRCVDSGPFADLVVQYEDGYTLPHCLTRAFAEEGFHGYSSSDVQNTTLEAILNIVDYEDFYEAVESGPHDTIPNMVRGDFWILTAPNDPIFFLHHANLDRLWWLWQQRNLTVRLSEYTGPARNGSAEEASLTNVLPMVGFAGDTKVADAIDTSKGLLCYSY
ncbi:hypothetical protein OCU04_001088 [Sclerotinia nivalis]|uniref:Tyrosinase copper-binding domain-containing protein n=1 Tax=Sclerotinia nivalis TaxID=352851 RepID=A0A9X0AXG5_9HELO|nr:hypothetical protein OCU04_001088 [Sclerotinia nivalis]